MNSSNEVIQLQRFEVRFAPLVAFWPTSLDELRWLAPSTAPPLTAAKVLAWQKPNGQGFLGFMTSTASIGSSDPPMSPLSKGGIRENSPMSPLGIREVLADPPVSPLGKGGSACESRESSSVQDAVPIAYAELNRMRNRRDHLWLGHCIVRPDMRRHGIGLHFVRALVTEAFGALNAKRVSLIVFPDNAAAIRCYLRAGFEVAGNERQRIAKGREELTFLRLEMWDLAQLDHGVSTSSMRSR